MIISLHIDGSPAELAEVLSKITDVETSEKPKTEKPKTVKATKAEPVKEEAPKAETQAENQPSNEEAKPAKVTLEQLRKLCAEKSKVGPEAKANVKATIKECGADSLGDLDASKYEELFTKLENL